MTAKRLRLLLVAVAVGAAGGAVAAVVSSGDAPGGAPPPPRIGRPLAPDATFGEIDPVVPPRIDLRRDDPRGGPAWVVRSFRGVLVTRERGREVRHSKLIRCVQLGREFGGRFGWIDGDNVFRPVGTVLRGAPNQCRNGGPRDPAGLEVSTLVDGLHSARPSLSETVIWGNLGPAARRLDLVVAGRKQRVPLARGGSFLSFAGPEVGASIVGALVRDAAGAKRSLPAQYSFGEEGFPIPPAGLPRPLNRPRPGAAMALDARAPDPGGGLSWGLASVPSQRGGYCVSETGRIIGDRVGRVDFGLGTLQDLIVVSPNSCPQGLRDITRRRALNVKTEIGDGALPLAERGPASGRVARRTLPGYTILSGRARADVTEITIQTPRGVRTAVPTSRGHAFIAVYDGDFPTGTIAVTARLRNGRSLTERFSNAGL